MTLPSIISILSSVILTVLSWSVALAESVQDAAMTGDLAALQNLLEAGSDPNHIKSEGGPTPLFFAAERGHPEAIELLLSHGAEVNALTLRGSALHIAARRGRIDIVKLLLDASADPNLIGGELYKRPLHEAAYNGSVEIVELLLNSGADVNGRTNYFGEEPAIHFAASRDHDAIVKLLRERGFQPWTPEPITAAELAGADLKLGWAEIQNCGPCHSFEPGGFGRRAPSLWNLIGKSRASDPGMAYSDAMADMTGVWDFEALNTYLADVQGSVPGTVKYLGTIRDRSTRIAAIAYLRTLADESVPLP
jgi:cytochrome c